MSDLRGEKTTLVTQEQSRRLKKATLQSGAHLVTEALLFTTDCSPSKLDHRSPTHNNRTQTYTKQTRLQLE